MKEFVDDTVEPEQWQQRFVGLDIIGRQSEKIAIYMSGHAKNVKSSEVLIIYQHKSCKELFPHDHLLSGEWTYLVHFHSDVDKPNL